MVFPPQGYGVEDEPYTYCIFLDNDGYYKAKNGKTGRIDFSSTDAATVIQNAIDASSDGSKILLKMQGKMWNITTTINVTKNTLTIEGDSDYDSVGYLSPVGDFPVISASNKLGLTLRHIGFLNTKNSHCVKLVQSDRVSIEGVRFEGSATSAAGGAIYAEECWVVTIERCVFRNLGSPSIAPITFRRPASPRYTGWCSDWKIIGCIFYVDKSSSGISPTYVIDPCDPNGCPTSDTTIVASWFESNRYVQNFIGGTSTGYADSYRIIGNYFTKSGAEAIVLRANSQIVGNFFISCGSPTSAQIKLLGGYNTVVGNTFSLGSNSQIIVYFPSTVSQSSVGRTVIAGNSCWYPSTRPKIFVSDAGYVALCEANSGVYPTRNRGTATIPAGQTSVTVTHGLVSTPTKIIVTPRANIGSVWVSSRDSTSFTINCSTAPTTDVVVDWEAEVFSTASL
jgi:hypothetical protein